MGFLDHSTNNIIIDAVLTDEGRKMLADNQGRFKVAFFSLGDDEVDYSIIEKFGRAVGQEKISKNTPIFEAQTKGSLALKHRLLTLPNPVVTRLPKLTMELPVNTTFAAGTSTTKFSFKQVVTGNEKIPGGVADSTFSIMISDRFLRVSGLSYISIENTTKIATYAKSRTGINNDTNAAEVEFSLVKREIDDTTYSIYGNGSTIETIVSVIGDQSGIRNDFKVTLTK